VKVAAQKMSHRKQSWGQSLTPMGVPMAMISQAYKSDETFFNWLYSM
jgi:hypothetical protein